MEQLNYSDVATCVSAFPLVGIGESTHGTHEFFETKAEVFKILVKDHGFDTFFFEAIDDHCEELNDHLRTGEGDVEGIINKLFYVWRTKEGLDLFKWLRSNSEKYPVRVVGLDERKHIDDYGEDYGVAKYSLRDQRMAEVIQRRRTKHSNAKSMLWAHDAHIAAEIDAAAWIEPKRIPMGHHLRQWFGEDYFNVAQLFGSGDFNTAVIEDSDAVDNSALRKISAKKVPQDFAEQFFAKKLKIPTFLEAPDFGGVLKPSTSYPQRLLGWGTQLSRIDEYRVYVNFSRAYKAVIFFPTTTASHRLEESS